MALPKEEVQVAKTAGFILGFSPKVLVTLITMGVVVFVSISFNAYLLATKDSTLGPLKTEVEDLKNDRTKLEGQIHDLREQITILKKGENEKIEKLTQKIASLENQGKKSEGKGHTSITSVRNLFKEPKKVVNGSNKIGGWPVVRRRNKGS